MTIVEISALVQSIVSLLIIITLYFTWRQVKEASDQSSRMAEGNISTTYRRLTENHKSLWISFFLNDFELRKWILESRGFENFDQTTSKIFLYSILKLDSHENLHWEYVNKILPQEAWNGWVNVIKKDFSTEEFQLTWRIVNGQYSPSFQKFINNKILPETLRTKNSGK